MVALQVVSGIVNGLNNAIRTNRQNETKELMLQAQLHQLKQAQESEKLGRQLMKGLLAHMDPEVAKQFQGQIDQADKQHAAPTGFRSSILGRGMDALGLLPDQPSAPVQTSSVAGSPQIGGALQKQFAGMPPLQQIFMARALMDGGTGLNTALKMLNPTKQLPTNSSIIMDASGGDANVAFEKMLELKRAGVPVPTEVEQALERAQLELTRRMQQRMGMGTGVTPTTPTAPTSPPAPSSPSPVNTEPGNTDLFMSMSPSGVTLSERPNPTAQATATEQAKRQLPMTPDQAQGLRHPMTMEAPPQGMTTEQAMAQGYRKVSDKVLSDIEAINSVDFIVQQLDEQSAHISTGETGPEQFMRGIQKRGEAFFQTDPIATAFKKTRESFLGVLARTLGGEKGVLTNADIARIANAIPTFFSSKQVRDILIGQLQQLASIGKQSAQRVAFGALPETERQALREQIMQMVAPMERIIQEGGGSNDAPTQPRIRRRLR